MLTFLNNLAIDCLTKKDNVEYSDYLIGVGKNSLARKVKMADLKDNLNLLELPKMKDSNLKRASKYYSAYKYLEEMEEQGKI